jgi:DNA-directed RNA polymerase specialized sigma24 family protein
MQQALRELQLQVKAEHYQIFHLVELEQKPIAEVAAALGRNRAQVYVVKHRVALALNRILKRLQKQSG